MDATRNERSEGPCDFPETPFMGKGLSTSATTAGRKYVSLGESREKDPWGQTRLRCTQGGSIPATVNDSEKNLRLVWGGFR